MANGGFHNSFSNLPDFRTAKVLSSTLNLSPLAAIGPPGGIEVRKCS